MKLAVVCACTAGIAHTYMAKEVIEQECKRRGIEVEVETQGGMGIDNELSQEFIDEADVAILAVAISIEGEDRFEEKKDNDKCIEIDPSTAIHNVVEILNQAEEMAK